ncbi:hypothetical protein GO755_37995 [Spirosoma sp. HMF4905]|uniref:Uncharacterized protein n=1 Tax=Spirosoma arboris TaxID=2682092 RepID=A0A7K1SQ52_9BACT|nr:hypothetical protein [Spirosoma arboris]MVM35870.1 hypothetical protein [Spirosoma arboris]
MKTGFYTLLFLFFAIIGYSQKVNIPKGATRIEISSTLSDSTLFDIISFRLESAGFFIAQSGKDNDYLITEYKNMGEAISIKVIVTVQGNIAVFRGQGEAEILGHQYTNVPLAYKGSGSGLEKSGFIVLNELVKKLSKTMGTSSINYLTPTP